MGAYGFLLPLFSQLVGPRQAEEEAGPYSFFPLSRIMLGQKKST